MSAAPTTNNSTAPSRHARSFDRHVAPRPTANSTALPDHPLANRRLEPGEGAIVLRRVREKTSIVRAEGANPLKLMIPRRRVAVPRIYISSYGGGLLAGDETRIHLHAEPGTRSVLTTQASTKIYKNPRGLPCGQTLDARIDADAIFVLAPEPISCFANSHYDQVQRFDVAEGGNLVIVDWMTSGRYEVGERFQFNHYYSRQSIHEDGRHILEDATRLDNADGPLDGPFRMGRFNCLATMIILGPRFREVIDQLLERERRENLNPGGAILAVAQPLSQGVLIRILSESTQDAKLYFDRIFEKIDPIIGASAWAGKL